MGLYNVNITGNLYKSLTIKKGYKAFEFPFDTIVANKEGRKLYISDFYILLNFSLLGTNIEEHKEENLINNKGKLELLLRISNVSLEENKRKYSNITKLEVDLQDNQRYIISPINAEVNFSTYRETFYITEITLDNEVGLGDYIIEILVKTTSNEKWKLQSLIPLRIE